MAVPTLWNGVSKEAESIQPDSSEAHAASGIRGSVFCGEEILDFNLKMKELGKTCGQDLEGTSRVN
jgi:hypothetical protein